VSRALDLAERAVRTAEGDEADASVHVERSGFARFADSAVHQPTLVRDETVTLRVVRGGRVGCATTNRTDDDGLADAARRAGEAADSSPVDPGFPGLQEPAPVPEVEGYDEATAALTPEEQAEAAAATIAAAPGLGLYGYYTSGTAELAVASTTGHAVSQTTTDVSVLALAAADDASGYAEATSWRAADLDVAAVAEEAAEEALTGCSDEYRPPEGRELVEPREQLDVVLDGLAEADAGVQADVLLRDPRIDGEREALLQERLDLGDDVLIARVLLHRPRLAQHVHEAQVGACVGHDARKVRVAAEGGDIVDHHRAQLERPPGHGGLRGVDGDREALQPLQDGLDAAELLLSGDAFRARAGRLAADVHEGRALLDEAECKRHRRLRP